ncbi:furin-like isoform X2 [Mercenaria mercenaria]|uniref:furin-like isoform X2 n=1 Tax=Mercenaria mercenaria TaxID=6596 RepID=UPI00234F7D93|nr:furin-like isoform X2 [Mercenaria mercenaria]
MITSIWLLVLINYVDTTEDKTDICAKEYMVQIEEKWLEYVKQRSEELGWKYKKKIVSNIHLFEAEHTTDKKRSIQHFRQDFGKKVLQVESRACSKLRFVPWLNESPAPPNFKQWLLTTRSEPKLRKTWPYYGMNIQEAWSMGLTGQDIKVAIVDSGVELKHKDLEKNIDRKLSTSFAEDDSKDGNTERLHSYPETDVYTSHGTKAAGLVAAEFGNGDCSAGVAFNATIIYDHIAQALEYKRNEIDIYSCSFGLANMFSESTSHIKAVLKEGVAEGRKGKGSIYVFSAGNRGNVYDCNTVPYTNSIYTITIASVGKGGTKPKYSMPCSSVLASTYGEYNTYNGTRYLETTTLDDKCDKFTGTSASAALASGIIALVLQANKNLTWRDVQHIVVMSSSFERLKYHRQTAENGNGLTYNPHFGFGLMDAAKAILLAQNWTTVPEMMSLTLNFQRSPRKNVRVYEVRSKSCGRCCLQYIEHVRVNLVYNIQIRLESHLEISLSSPSGTRSVLLHRVKRQSDKSNSIVRNWNFTSVQFWGEKPYGNWTLRMKFRGVQYTDDVNVFWLGPASLTLYGTIADPYSNVARVSTFYEANCKTWSDRQDISSTASTTQHDSEGGLEPEVLPEDEKYLFMNVVSIAFCLCVILCVCFVTCLSTHKPPVEQ